MPFDLKYTRAADIKDKLEALLGVEKKQQNAGPMTPEVGASAARSLLSTEVAGPSVGNS